MPPPLAGHVVIVTWGAAGLGSAICTAIAQRGAAVLIADRDQAGAVNLQQAIESSGGKALAVEVDVLSEAALRHMVECAIARFGHVDCLVNNAGTLGPVRSLLETTDADVDHVFGINVRAVYACTRMVARHMVERQTGSIVTIASVAGKEGPKDLSIYAASKAAVIGFTKSWAKELVGYGIRVNCVAPALIEATGMQREMPDSFTRDSVSRIPMARPARAGEVLLKMIIV